jgi:hypothetical protein
MPYAGSLALLDLFEKTDTLVTACSRCNRVERHPVAILIKRHGRYFTVPELLHDLSHGCVKRGSVDQPDLCGVHCPDLPALFISRPTMVAPSSKATLTFNSGIDREHRSGWLQP